MTDLTWRDANGISSMLLVQRWTDAEQDPPSRATLADIAAALAARGLCVVPKGRHDWVFGEEVMKRDEEIARLTAELATEKAAVADYVRLWEELTNKVSELTAEQQRRQEVERDRDGWKRAAESQNRQWSKKCAQLTDVRADLERAERELASCRKVVEAAKRAAGELPSIDSLPRDGHIEASVGAIADLRAELADAAFALASAGKDSGEVNPPGIPESSILATDQSAGPNGGQNAAAQLRESLGAPGTTRWDEMLAMVRGMRASHSEIDVRLKALSLRVAEGLEAKGTAATVPRGEVEALWRHALSRSRCLSRGDRPEAGDEWAEIASAIKALLAKTEVNS